MGSKLLNPPPDLNMNWRKLRLCIKIVLCEHENNPLSTLLGHKKCQHIRSKVVRMTLFAITRFNSKCARRVPAGRDYWLLFPQFPLHCSQNPILHLWRSAVINNLFQPWNVDIIFHWISHLYNSCFIIQFATNESQNLNSKLFYAHELAGKQLLWIVWHF